MSNQLTQIPIKTIPDLTGATEVMLQVRKQDESGLSVPTKPFLEWLAKISCGKRFRNMKSEVEGANFHLLPIESDLKRASTVVFGYELKDNHTDYQVAEMTEYIYNSYPSLFYNHKYTVKENEKTKEEEVIYETGEVYAAFKLAYTGKLGLAAEDAKVYGNGDRINLNKIARVLDAYMKYRNPALMAIDKARDKEQKLLEANSEAAQMEKDKKNKEAFSWWLVKWEEVNKNCQWRNLSEVQGCFYDIWIDEYKLHEFSNDEKWACMDIAKTLLLRTAQREARDPNTDVAVRVAAKAIIDAKGEPSSVTEKARIKTLAQKVLLYMHLTGRNPLDEKIY